ncbi:hypothetical protein SAMN02745857_03500 [Andreprevotia lacus DSM 23236]|jgi:hypothetical protein|uniref:Uncharacterized protein n=1 Tax=Andreprevotia lacus DSM 23236 TaxID=1121001 RepID=A0A1W1XZM9_9NEIS|nr:hypothetical protein [Andreprevotia lacus]SMC28948.1 hypothetical protein SAMN02745857_03500 [Andreprevotia lacus DSM 23236]
MFALQTKIPAFLILVSGACALAAPTGNEKPQTKTYGAYTLEAAGKTSDPSGYAKLGSAELTSPKSTWLKIGQVDAERKRIADGATQTEISALISTARDGFYIKTALRLDCTTENAKWLHNAEVIQLESSELKHVADIKPSQYLGIPHEEDIDGFTAEIPFKPTDWAAHIHKLLCSKDADQAGKAAKK